MSSPEQKKQAWVTALRMLAASPKSRHELESKLRIKGYPETVIGDVLDGLEKQNLLNDQAYAEELFNKYRYGKPSGRRRIDFELKRHGVATALREKFLSQMSDSDEAVAAREMAQALWDRTNDLTDLRRRKKVYDFLTRRGFDFQLARDVVDELAGSDNDER